MNPKKKKYHNTDPSSLHYFCLAENRAPKKDTVVTRKKVSDSIGNASSHLKSRVFRVVPVNIF